MRPWLRRGAGPNERDAGPQWTGAALVNAVADLAAGDAVHARAVAFAVAQAAREGDDHAMRALADMLAEAPAAAAFDEGTLVNVLSALQFASMLPDDARTDWVPARDAVARTVEMGLRSGEALREQTEGLLWALVDRRLAADWLGPDAGTAVASRVASFELRERLISQLRTHKHLISFVAGGEEFPCVPA